MASSFDPQSQSFTPNSSNNDTQRLQTDVTKLQQVQADHSDRLSRLERRREEDVRVKGAWGQSSPFPGILSGGSGTPQPASLQHPSSDNFRDFDDDANQLMTSLHLDTDDEPRRGLGTTSRANSVRFDETANQNHFTHSTRPSMDVFARPANGLPGLGALQMNERTLSNMTEGRGSSQLSIRSVATSYGGPYEASDVSRSPLNAPAMGPGFLFLSAVPAIIRAWITAKFSRSNLLYAVVCTASLKSYISLTLAQKLALEDKITTNEEGVSTIILRVWFPEAVPYPGTARIRDSRLHVRLPEISVQFEVIDLDLGDDYKIIQVFLGSDVLHAHNADIMFSNNHVSLFDDHDHKVKIPFVRPDSDKAFKDLYTVCHPRRVPAETEKAENEAKEETDLNGVGQYSSAASMDSTTTSPPPGKYRPPGAIAAEAALAEASIAATAGSDSDVRPDSQHSTSSRPSLSLLNIKSDTREQSAEAGAQATPLRSGSSPAIWSNWRRDAPMATTTPQSIASDWADASKQRENAYQRKDTGMKVLKPKTPSRLFSSTGIGGMAGGGTTEKTSRFFPDARRKSDGETKPIGSEMKEAKAETDTKDTSTPPATLTPKTKSNPIGSASAFSWLNPGSGNGGK